jgi:hypothetical protein
MKTGESYTLAGVRARLEISDAFPTTKLGQVIDA